MSNKSMTDLESWICAWARLFSAIIVILTFAKVNPGFDIDLLTHYMVKNIEKRKQARKLAEQNSLT